MNEPENQEEKCDGNHDAKADDFCWKVVSASARGSSHEKTGKPCQDAHHWIRLSEGILLAAVADGAGSAAQSEVGSEVAAKAAVAAIASKRDILLLDEGDEDLRILMTHALEEAREAVETKAAEHDVKVRDLATTLIVIFASPKFVAAAQIGDGAAVVGDAAGRITALTKPESGEYINETIFLTSSDAMESAQVNVWYGNTGYIAALSDGLQLLALEMPEGKPHGPFFSPLFRFIERVEDAKDAESQLEKFLISELVRERTNDDLTLILARLFENAESSYDSAEHKAEE